jgi:photosystem II stability/assembly factor-like uncharacterized protein/predicted esterase
MREFVLLPLILLCACPPPTADDTGTLPGPGDSADSAPPPCEGEAGSFGRQVLEVEGEERFYFLHVPEAYDCTQGMPLLIDFHGTVSGYGSDTAAEEAYGQEALLALAEREGFIVVRPRSLSADWGGTQVFQWDIGAGHLDQNVTFARALILDLQARYHVLPDRLYASGFSNGTNMAAQLLGEGELGVDGYAMIGGGVWRNPGMGDLSESVVRVWATTGYRDYMWPYQRDLVEALASAGLPSEQVLERETDAGHELVDWYWDELWAWLDRGEGPVDGALNPGWSQDDHFPSSESLLELVETPDGGLLAVGTGGGAWLWDGESWSEQRAPGEHEPLVSACIQPDGTGVAAGFDRVVTSADGGVSWIQAGAVPDFSGTWGDGHGRVNGVGCGDALAVAGGYWTGAVSEDGGESWSPADIEMSGGYSAQLASIRFGEHGTAVAAGYYYLGRSEDGVSFEPTWSRWDVHWFHDAAPGPEARWWVVGEAGVALTSDDDGESWEEQSTGVEADLYAVDFRDAQTGLAVGSHGAAVLTRDGGETWEDVSTGLDRFLGGVRFLDDGRAMVVGEGGTVLLFEIDPGR